jgi:SAM-dependent methyltransferase
MFSFLINDNTKLLDVGSGTGMLLDHLNILPKNYIGIDPSFPMIKEAKHKYKDFEKCFYVDKFETHLKKYDLIVSLFGSMNYVIDLYLETIYDKLEVSGKYFLMFFKHEYYPLTYELTGVELYHYKYKKNALKSIFYDATITEYHNYYIVTNI